MSRKNMNQFHIYFSQRERQLLRHYSEKTGLTQSQIVRLLVNGAVLHEAPPAVDREIVSVLYDILNKLNDIDRSITFLGETSAGENYDRELLRAVSNALCGAVTGIENRIYGAGEKINMEQLMETLAGLPSTAMENAYRKMYPEFVRFCTEDEIKDLPPLESGD